MEEIESRIFVISPNSDLTPPRLYRYLVDQGFRLRMKETCFGLIIEGEKNTVKKVVRKIGELDKYGVFSKIRAYPPGDLRICRANRGGGPRLGFHFLEFEHRMLPSVGAALKSLDEGKVVAVKLPEKKAVPIRVIRKLIEKFEKRSS